MADEVDYNYKGGNGWQFKGSTGFDWGYRLISPGGVVLSAAGGDSDSGAAMRAICREADQQAARIVELEAQVVTLRGALGGIEYGARGAASYTGDIGACHALMEVSRRAYEALAATEARND